MVKNSGKKGNTTLALAVLVAIGLVLLFGTGYSMQNSLDGNKYSSGSGMMGGMAGMAEMHQRMHGDSNGSLDLDDMMENCPMHKGNGSGMMENCPMLKGNISQENISEMMENCPMHQKRA